LPDRIASLNLLITQSPQINDDLFYRGFHLKHLSQSDEDATRQEVADLLWFVFPAASERGVAEAAAKYLPRTPRQIQNYLRQESNAPAYIYRALKGMASAERVAQRIENGPDRSLRSDAEIRRASGRSGSPAAG